MTEANHLQFRADFDAVLQRPDAAAIVDAALLSRRSIRAFLPTPVPRATIEEILLAARQAPSGTNLQPWKVYVTTGAVRERLSQAILDVCNDPQQLASHKEEHAYYPDEWFSPYLERRRKVGFGLYGVLGLTRENRAGMRAQSLRNYRFFDAPVGLIFTISRRLNIGSWLDYGMFLENIMIAARARGLDTCPQAAFTHFHRVVREQLGIDEEEMVVCGMALGVADASKVDNSLQTERMPLEEFVRFME